MAQVGPFASLRIATCLMQVNPTFGQVSVYSALAKSCKRRGKAVMTTIEATKDIPTASALSPPKLTLLPLTALVVGSMIGGGVFSLRSD